MEVSKNSTSKEIKAVYLKICHAYDSNNLATYPLMEKEQCKAMLRRINEAYSVIIDPIKRQKYNLAHGINMDESYRSHVYDKENLKDVRYYSKIKNIIILKKFALHFDIDEKFEQKISDTLIYTGEFLKKIREYKNVNLKQLAERTKISQMYLVAIESDNLSALPNIAYVRGFIYQYAKYLKLNVSFVTTSYIDYIEDLHRQKRSS